MAGVMEQASSSARPGRLGVRLGGELKSIREENLELEQAMARSIATAHCDVDPTKEEEQMLHLAVAESLETAFEASTDASDFARMRQEPWACRVALFFSRFDLRLEKELLSSPAAWP